MLQAILNFKLNGKDTVWEIAHNLDDFGLDIEAAFVNWEVRTDTHNIEDFIEYVKSKDPVNIICMRMEDFKKWEEQAQIGDRPYIVLKEDRKFKDESLFGLNVGDKIKQIGKPKITSKNKTGITSSNRVDTFKGFAEYVGTDMRKVNEDEEDSLVMVFKLSSEDITGITDQFVYAIYFVAGEGADQELLVPALDHAGIYIFKPHFEKI